MKSKSNVDAMKGVVKPDTLRIHMKQCAAGDANSRSYVRGALQYLERKPPNPFIVKVLRKLLEQR